MPRIALYPGSFDPPTFGHLDIIEKALDLFDELVVAIGMHPGKMPLFSPEERAELIRCSLGGSVGHEQRVRVSYFSDLVTSEAARQRAIALVRGLRDGTDLDYEMQMAGMNGRLAPNLVTVFLPPSIEARPITATLVRQIARMGGDVSHFVPPHVAFALQHKLAASQSLSGDSR